MFNSRMQLGVPGLEHGAEGGLAEKLSRLLEEAVFASLHAYDNAIDGEQLLPSIQDVL